MFVITYTASYADLKQRHADAGRIECEKLEEVGERLVQLLNFHALPCDNPAHQPSERMLKVRVSDGNTGPVVSIG